MKFLEQRKLLMDAVNETDAKVVFPAEYFKPIPFESIKIPQSFYEAFGEGKVLTGDFFRQALNVKTYLNYLTEGKVNAFKSSEIVQVIKDGYTDAELILEVRRVATWNRRIEKNSFLYSESEIIFSCQLSEAFHSCLCMDKQLQRIYDVVNFNEIAKHIEVGVGFKKYEVCPNYDFTKMAEDFKSDPFSDVYEKYIRKYENFGYFDSLKFQAAMGNFLSKISVVQQVSSFITYEALMPAIHEVIWWGGKICWYRPFTMVVALPEGIKFPNIAGINVYPID